MNDELAVSVDEAARRINVSPRTMVNLISRGEIASRKIGRRRLIPVGALETFLRKDHATKPRPKARPFGWPEVAGTTDDKTKRKGNDNASESPRIQPQS
jgi:excisionase family DNA binding protein